MLRSALRPPASSAWILGPVGLTCLAVLTCSAQVPSEGLIGRYLKMTRESKTKPKTAEEAKTTQIAKSKVPITGAFGYRLGEVGKPGRPAGEQEDSIAYQFKPAQPWPGFTRYFVTLTPLTNRVGLIQLEGFSSDPAFSQRTLATLSATHGPNPTKKVEGDKTTYTWADGKREVELEVGSEYVRLYYNDHTHDETALEEMKVRRASPPPPAVLKGPLHLRALSGAHAFGVDLGGPLIIPEGATREPTYVAFDFGPRDPVPGFGRHTVFLMPADSRAYQVTAYSTSLNPAEQEQLIADLEARFGPSTLDETNKGLVSRSWLFPGDRRIILERGPDEISLTLNDEKLQLAADAAAKK